MKQLALNFTRQQTSKGTFKTSVQFVRVPKKAEDRQRGILHKAVGLKNRVQGDVPSLTKKLDSIQPNSVKGIIGVSAAKGTYKFVKVSGKAAVNTALGAENAALLLKDKAVQQLDRKLRAETETSGDVGKAVIKATGLVLSGANGIRRHSISKKNFKQQNSLLKQYVIKSEKTSYSLHGKKNNLKKSQQKLKGYKKNVKLSGNTPVQKQRLKLRKKRVKAQSKNVRRSSLMLRMQKDRVKLQERIAKHDKTVPLALQPGVHAVKSIAASGRQKAVSADPSNDVMKAIDKSVSLLKKGGGAAAKARHVGNQLQLKLYNKSITSEQKSMFKKSNQAFGKKKNSGTNFKSAFKKKWKKWKNPNAKNPYKSFGDFAKDASKSLKKAARDSLKSSALGFLSAALPVICFVLCFLLVGTVIIGIFKETGFTLATYQAKDNDLTEAAEYYTKLSYDLNEAVLKCGDKNTWRNGLSDTGGDFGYNYIKYPEDPDSFIYGKDVNFLNYDEADYDFDPYVLWSFLCAYFYDFDESEKAKSEGKEFKPDYWTFNSTAKNIVKELFQNEYQFKFYYDNKSRWEELSTWNYWGGGDSINGEYYLCESTLYRDSGKAYTYHFKPIQSPTELNQFKDKDGYIYIKSDYRVVNPNKDFADTGFYIMDNRYPSGSKSPFYYHDDLGRYWYYYNGKKNWAFRAGYGWKINETWDEAWFVITHKDTSNWCGKSGALYGLYEKYQWKTDCRLYYVVTQNGSFEDNARKLLENMSYKDERIKYFNALVGQDDNKYYGNHQLFSNPVYPDKNIHKLIEEGKVYNDYGYDMQKWNSRHCSLSNHSGIDISCNLNTEVSSMITGEITKIDNTNHVIEITSDDKFNFWYDNKKNTVRITYENVQAKSGLSVGTQVTVNDIVGTVTGDRRCDGSKNDNAVVSYIHIKIETGKDKRYYDTISPMISIY